MRFKKLILYTNKFEEELYFYSKKLGFEIIEQNTNSFTAKIGWSELTFKKSDKERKYHYCFLIPSNLLNQALEWMENSIETIEIEKGRKIQHFETWNADSFYFYDASGNIAEFIVRYDLKNESKDDFNISKVLCINEIGMPSKSIETLNNQLQHEIKTIFWKGDLKRFATNGNQEGIFLLPNYEIKDIWFPTEIKIKPEPFETIVENEGNQYLIEFSNEKIKTTANNV